MEILYCREEGGNTGKTNRQAGTDTGTHRGTHRGSHREREKKGPKPSQTFLHINKANTELSPVLTKAVRRCSIAM